MEINLSIYNRILFSDLRPWLTQNKSESKFETLLNASSAKSSNKKNSIDNIIASLLKNFSKSNKEENSIIEISDSDPKFTAITDEIYEPLIDVYIPDKTNSIQSFYSFLIVTEGTRFMNNIHKSVQYVDKENEKKYIVHEALQQVDALIKNNLEQRISITKTLPENQQKNTEVVFETLQNTLIRLHLELKSIFNNYLGTKAFSLEGIFENILKEKLPEKCIVKDEVSLNNFFIKQYINSEEYNKEKTLDLIARTIETGFKFFNEPTTTQEETLKKKIVNENIKALENFYYIKEFFLSVEELNYEKLISNDFNELIYEKAESLITEKIEQFKFGSRRLPVIAKEELQLAFLKQPFALNDESFLLSIPRRIKLILDFSKAAANANLAIDFSKISDTTAQRIKTTLSVPQLAFLFMALNELNPKIFDVNSEAELHRFISASFGTKKSSEEGISIDKLRQLFNQPDSKAADFWFKHLSTLTTIAKKFK